jgi:ankyrin repeat protein
MCEHIDIVRKLVAHGANINAQCSEGNTLLRWTCKYGNTDLVSYLLDIKADASMPNYDLCTPLIAACEEDNADVVQLLLERSDAAKACIDEQMADEETALITASRVNAVSCIKLLIAAGADVHLSEGFGLTALHLTDDVEIARMLIGAGATDARDNDGYTAMMRACNVGVPDLLKVLLEHGFDVNAVSNTGTSALMIAARNSPSTLQVLLSANPPPDMNKKCSRGYTALRYAAEQGSYEAVEMLLNAGADPTLADLCGITPLMQACDPETVRLLVNAAPDSVHRRCEIGRNALSYLSEKPLTSDALVSLLECDSAYNLCLDVNAANDVGDTTLHFAMGDANVVAVELLLEKGADVFHIGYRGTTVLMTLLQVGASTMAEEEDEDNEDEDDISLDEDMENGDEDMDEGDDDENSVISVAGASKCVELILDHVLWRAD